MTQSVITLAHRSTARGYIAGVGSYNPRDKTYIITATTVTALWYPITSSVYIPDGQVVHLVVNGVQSANTYTYQSLIPQETQSNGPLWTSTTGTYTLEGRPVISALTGNWLMTRWQGLPVPVPLALSTLSLWSGYHSGDIMPPIVEMNHILFDEASGAPVAGTIGLVW